MSESKYTWSEMEIENAGFWCKLMFRWEMMKLSISNRWWKRKNKSRLRKERAINIEEMTNDEKNLLLYCESRAVDNSGRLDTRNMNGMDHGKDKDVPSIDRR